MGKEANPDVSPKTDDSRLYSEVITFLPVSAPVAFEEITNAAHFRFHYFEIDLVGVSGTLKFRIEGRLGHTGAFRNLAADGSDTEYTADGAFWLDTTRGVRCDQVRLVWVSGTATSVDVKYRGGN